MLLSPDVRNIGIISTIKHRDVSTRKFLVQPLQWWAESATPGWNRVKIFEYLGATMVLRLCGYILVEYPIFKTSKLLISYM